MMPWRGLRLRFIVASGLLVLTTIVAGAWTLVSLSRLGRIVSETVADSDLISAATAGVSGALEREDDALLLVLSGDQQARTVLAREREAVNYSLTALTTRLSERAERDLVHDLRAAIAAYREAADTVASAPAREALARYHLDANPLLRRAVESTTAIRERRFETARAAVAQARDAAERAQRAVLVITLIALAIAVAVAVHLTGAVVGPLRSLTRGADAIRQGRFGEPIAIASRDELGDLAAAFNHMAEDLAEFRRTNVREVLRAKAALEATLEALPDAVALFDADGRMVSMNRTAANVFAATGVAGPQTIDDIRLGGLDVERIRQTIRGEADAAPHGADLARTIPVEEGQSIRRLLPRVLAVPSLGPSRGGAILLLYDVTDLAKVDELRSELVAVASHELQTPLTTLRMTLLMLREGADALPHRHRELVTTALLGVDQLTEIVHEFLDLTRIEAGELRLNLGRVSMPDLVRDAIARSASRAVAQDIRLGTAIGPDVPAVLGDAPRLRSVLDNLLSNALKYAPPGSAVTVAVSHDDIATMSSASRVIVSVTDGGPGVPPAYRTRVFEKFFRLEHHVGDGRTGARGAGIGLYMCRQITELHGGHIGCTAGAGGVGARFFIELPAAASQIAFPNETEMSART